MFTSSFTGPGQYDTSVPIPGGGSCRTRDQSISCKLGTIPAGVGVVLGFALDVTAAGTIVQDFAVTARQDDVDLSNNSGSISTAVQPRAADLSLGLRNSPGDPSYTFQQLVWQVEVDNHGPLAPGSVVVTGTMSGPASWDASQSNPGCSVDGATITCDVGGLFVGGGAILGLVAHPTPGTVGATFSTSSELSDQDLSSNSVAAPSISVLPSADLRVIVCCVTATSGSVVVHLFVNNNGPDDDTGATLVDAWSPTGASGATLVGVSPSQGTCTAEADSLTCSLGTIGAGRSATVDVSLQAPSGTAVTDTASISGDLFDYNSSDDSTTVTVILP